MSVAYTSTRATTRSENLAATTPVTRPDDGEAECHRVHRGQALVHLRVQPDDHDDHRHEKEKSVEEELLRRTA